MDPNYGKAFGHFLMAFGHYAFGERDEEPSASDTTAQYGSSGDGRRHGAAATPAAPKRACCLARRPKVPVVRTPKRGG